MRTVSYSKPPIMLRASITQAEWAELRKLAIDRKATVQTLVADALRQTYDLNGEKK